MAEVFLTPADDGAAIELSSTMYRKKILPMGSIDYKGRKIVFDKAYLTDLAESFRANAYDQVPFVLADKDNAHTMDPERFRGECKGVEVSGDGLYGTFELTADAADLVKANPGLGVSARIVEGYSRSDGKSFPRAMQHVLGTLDPRIPGMGAWTEVSLSGYDSGNEIIDLTSSAYEGATVAKTEETEETVDGLTREEYEALLASLELTDEDEDGEEDEDEDEDGDAEAEAEQKQLIGAGASLSNEAKTATAPTSTERTAIDLANEQIAELKAGRAKDKFDADKREYVRRGVPPALVELARPVLEAPDGFTIDLANGDGENKVDAAHIVRQLLDSATGYIALAQERGHSVDFANEAADGETDEDAEALKLWGAMVGDETTTTN